MGLSGSTLHEAGISASAAILEIPEVRRRISRLSLADYHRLNEFNENGRRTELIRGIAIEKVSKSPLHRTICSRLYKLLLTQLPKGWTVWKEEPLTLSDSEPEPDISVTRGTESDFTFAHPSTAELVAEVSVSSAALDRANASLYAEANVREYWIVLAQEQRIEVYRQPEAGRYGSTESLGPDATLSCAAFPQLQIRTAELWK